MLDITLCLDIRYMKIDLCNCKSKIVVLKHLIVFPNLGYFFENNTQVVSKIPFLITTLVHLVCLFVCLSVCLSAIANPPKLLVGLVSNAWVHIALTV